MISSIYSYYLSQYGHKECSRQDTHSRAQLKYTSGRVSKINSHAPAYKLDLSDDALRYAIDLKENARQLNNIANDLSGDDDNSMVFKRSASSSNTDIVDVEFIGDNDSEACGVDISISQLASNQINTGNFLPGHSRLIEPGDYSFDLRINDLTYQFEFNVSASENTNDIQNKIMRLINRSDIGLKADILNDNLGNSAISISSNSTGITDIKPTIFNIRVNSAFNGDSSNAELISTLGLDRVSQYPSNAVYTIDDQEFTSPTNDVVYNHEFALTLKDTTGAGFVSITMDPDADAITDSINGLVSGYNNLVSVTANSENDKFEGNLKLKRDFERITHAYTSLLSENGLSVNDNGTIRVDDSMIKSAASEDNLSDIFSKLNTFKNAIQKKAEDISLDPMNYVNNKIVAYKNPTRTYHDPYNLSAYTGMMFNGYI